MYLIINIKNEKGFKMKLNKILLCAAAAFAFQSQALAAKYVINYKCDTPKSPYERALCKSKAHMDSEDALNKVYQQLRKQLSKSEQNDLKNAQVQWLKYRADRCLVNGEIDIRCAIFTNNERTEYLYECKDNYCDSWYNW